MTIRMRGSAKIIPNSENTFAVSPARRTDVARLDSAQRVPFKTAGIMNANENAVAEVLGKHARNG